MHAQARRLGNDCTAPDAGVNSCVVRQHPQQAPISDFAPGLRPVSDGSPRQDSASARLVKRTDPSFSSSSTSPDRQFPHAMSPVLDEHDGTVREFVRRLRNDRLKAPDHELTPGVAQPKQNDADGSPAADRHDLTEIQINVRTTRCSRIAFSKSAYVFRPRRHSVAR